MTIQSWFMYLMLVLVATTSPGPAVLFIVTHSTLHGWRKAVFSALGNITGLFCLGILAVTGLGAVLKTSEMIFNGIKYAGSAYLIYLGLKLLFRKDARFNPLRKHLMPHRISSGKLFLQAFGVAVSNPKAIMFLTALFPQFLNVEAPLMPQFLMLIAILMFFSFFFLMCYALAADRVRSWFNRPKGTAIVHRTSGAVFVGFGILLAASSNR